METYDVNEIIKKMLLSHSAMVRLVAKAMEHDEDGGKKNCSLTKAQFNLLQLIHSLEKTTVSTLVAATGISKSSISLTLTKMENDGFVKRVPADENDDKRKVYIVLTEKGRERFAGAAENFICKISSFYNNLNEEDKVLFENIVESSYKLFVDNKEAVE